MCSSDLEILVEVGDSIMTDSISEMEKLKSKLESALSNNLYINADIKLVEPMTLERSMGKSVRVVDSREKLN